MQTSIGRYAGTRLGSRVLPAQVVACQNTVARTFGFTVLGFFAFGGFAAAGFVADFTFLTFGLSPVAAFGLDTYASGKGKIWQQQGCDGTQGAAAVATVCQVSRADAYKRY